MLTCDRAWVLNALIIGGSRFQGPLLIERLLSHGIEVFVFNRGSRFPESTVVSHIIGDRNSIKDLKKISNHQFDVVIDTCAYRDQHIMRLKGIIHTRLYCLLSSTFVYANTGKPVTESDDLLSTDIAAEATDRISHYGLHKIACEEKVKNIFGSDSLIVRPSPIIGENDHTERMRFWVDLIRRHKLRSQGSQGQKKIQLLDIRDATAFITLACRNGLTGTFNLAARPITRTRFLKIIEEEVKKILHQNIGSEISIQKDLVNQLPFFSQEYETICNFSAAKKHGFKDKSIEKSIRRVTKSELEICKSLTKWHYKEKL
jgi:2'-hydroxyisoflavone reductase